MTYKQVLETRIYFSFDNKKHLKWILEYLNIVIKGYTIYKTKGYWKGISESSRVIEIIHSNTELTSRDIRIIAKDIKTIGNQESVLITTKHINTELV